MSQSEPTTNGRARRSRFRVLAVGLAAVALSGVAAGQGEAQAAVCAGANDQPTASRDALARATLCLVNAERGSRGMRPLRLNRQLSVAAQSHSRDMVRRRYFSHTAPGGRGFFERIRRSGYLRSARRWSIGENLGWGSSPKGSPGPIVEAWMQSPPHRRAILTAAFRDAGIGVVSGIPSPLDSGGATYTIDFGVKH